MTTINLSDMNVQSCTLTVSEVRELIDGSWDDEDFETALDTAQGNVKTGLYPKSFVVIEVIPDETEVQNPAA